MREITSHRINQFNRNHIEISALDGPGPGGASHLYCIDVWKGSKNSDGPADMATATEDAAPPVEMRFQNGAIGEVGPNGITDEALLAIVIDRIQGFQKGQFSCRENALALTKLEEAMHWLHHRTQQREARGVEGTSKA